MIIKIHRVEGATKSLARHRAKSLPGCRLSPLELVGVKMELHLKIVILQNGNLYVESPALAIAHGGALTFLICTEKKEWCGSAKQVMAGQISLTRKILYDHLD